jgi:hypothetical protein
MEKIKEHIKKYKREYIVGIASAGITAITMRGLHSMVSNAALERRHATLQSGVDGLAKVTVRPFSLNFLSKECDNVVTTIHNGGRGHPGFRVRNIEQMIDFDTQGETARAFNISPSILSSHLNGKLDNANGLHFERIPA